MVARPATLSSPLRKARTPFSSSAFSSWMNASPMVGFSTQASRDDRRKAREASCSEAEIAPASTRLARLSMDVMVA